MLSICSTMLFQYVQGVRLRKKSRHADNGNGIITETWGIRLRDFTHEGI